MNNNHRIKLNEMLWYWFGLKLPDDFIDSLVKDNPDIMVELEAGSITDTMARERTIDAILNKFGMRPWPTYGELAADQTICQKIDAELYKNVSAIGGEYIFES